MIRLVVCVVHAAHLPARVPLMNRLRESLGMHTDKGLILKTLSSVVDLVGYHEETTRGKYIAWHERSLTHFLAERERCKATHCLTLQDDVIPSSAFWSQLAALLEGRPRDVICLDCAHPAARQIFTDGDCGYTTADGLVGIGHVEPIEIVADFATWRTNTIRRGSIERITEDSLFGLYCMHREIPIFAPVPCLLDHDLDIESTNEGFDQHWYRRPQVTMRELERLDEQRAGELRANMLDPAWWARPAPHLGRFYDAAHEYLPLILDDPKLPEIMNRHAVDRTPDRYARFFVRVGAFA